MSFLATSSPCTSIKLLRSSKRSCSAIAERVGAPYHQTCSRTNIKQN